jgi:hypothetical protein
MAMATWSEEAGSRHAACWPSLCAGPRSAERRGRSPLGHEPGAIGVRAGRGLQVVGLDMRIKYKLILHTAAPRVHAGEWSALPCGSAAPRSRNGAVPCKGR